MLVVLDFCCLAPQVSQEMPVIRNLRVPPEMEKEVYGYNKGIGGANYEEGKQTFLAPQGSKAGGMENNQAGNDF